MPASTGLGTGVPSGQVMILVSALNVSSVRYIVPRGALRRIKRGILKLTSITARGVAFVLWNARLE